MVLRAPVHTGFLSQRADLEQVYGLVAASMADAERQFRAELASDEPAITELCEHVERYHGKRIRPVLLLLTGQACGELCPEHATVAAVVEMVHIATLVHDDVLDKGELRRRAKTVNRLWGNGRAIMLGDLLFSHAYRLCSSLDSQLAAQTVAQAAITVCEGEMLQIANRANYGLSERTYFDIIRMKTAALIGACMRLGATHAGADIATCDKMDACGTALGIAFQIVDDLLDLTGDEAAVGKSLGRDAHQGELTLPLIHYLRESSDADQAAMRGALEAHDGDQIAKLLRESASVAYARQMAREYVERGRALLRELPASAARDGLLALADFIIARDR